LTDDSFDLIVIGAGSAARDAAGRAASRHGARVALIERERWGGSCPNVACSPTKAYLVAADLIHDVNELAGLIGIEVSEARANLARIRERKEALKKPQAKWVADLQAQGYATFEGEASFVDARTLRVGDRELTAERILIATGSRTAVPPIAGIEGIDWLDHISALELTEVPESLLVVGAGAVGLEFGQAFSRFGSQVTIVDALDQIAPHTDLEAARELQASLEGEGIPVLLGTFVQSVARDGGGLVATLAPREGGGTREIRAERILLASGRKPNVEELALDRAGVELGRLGVVVDGRLRTSVPGIWAAGDVTGLAPFTPAAQYQARIAVDDMFGVGGREADYTVLPTAIFTDPELAGVGLTEEEATARGIAVGTAVHPLAGVRRATYLNVKHGLFKIVYDRTSRKVLGLHVVSRNASDIVQGLAVAISLGATVDDLALAHHTFPTFGEGVKAAAEKALA
jgi:mercuric reductase